MGQREVAIRVEDLTIRYRSLKSYSIKKNLLHLNRNKKEYFEAVKHVSFAV